jgi:hypothetical protein
VTYGIVFNMGFLTNKAKQAYLPKRKNLVEQMQKQEGY